MRTTRKGWSVRGLILYVFCISLAIGCSTSPKIEREKAIRLDPKKTQIPDSYELEFSWTGGDGPGDVFLYLSKSGIAKLIAKPYRGGHEEYYVQLPKENVDKIFEMVESERFSKIEWVRSNVCRTHIGVYRVRSKEKEKEVEATFGETETNSDPEYFGELVQKILELRPMVGPQLDWGPRSSSSYPC